MNSLKVSLIASACLLALCNPAVGQSPATTHQIADGNHQRIIANPLKLNYRFQFDEPSRREAADPVIEYFNGKYYLFASKSGGYWSSPDLAEWTFIPCKTLPTEDYAPTAMALGNSLYFLASSGTPIIYKTTHPDKDNWEAIDTKFPYGMTDPAFYKDDDGRVYIYSGCSDKDPIIGVEVDPKDGFRALGEPVVLIKHQGDKYGWEVPGVNNEEDRTGWNEGAAVIKYKGKYYLQYAAPGTQYRIYGDGVYVSDKPLGPFTYEESNPFSFKPGGFIGGAGHGHTFMDQLGNYWHVATMTISVRHMFERRIGLFPVYFAKDHTMHTHTAFTDYPFLIPDKQTDFEHNDCSLNWNLLSYGKPVASSSSLPGFETTRVNDEQVETWWAANTGNAGEWLQIDLGKKMDVRALQVNFADQDFTVKAPDSYVNYSYYIECSTDGQTWHRIIDRSKNQKDYPHELIVLPAAQQARYFRITNTKNMDGKFSLSDLRIFGYGNGNLPQPVSQILIARDPKDKRIIRFHWNKQKDATGYVIRWGTSRDQLTNSSVVHDNTYEARYFNRDSPYYFSIDAFNESGITKGKEVIQADDQMLFRNEQAPMHDRIQDFLSRLTIEEKVGLLISTSPDIPRLGITHYYHGNEALHGVVRPGRFTVFPQAIGLAAMWNPDLHYKVATAISDEARARWNELDGGKNQTMQYSDLLTFWSPTVNMARDPRWGRTPETYGEDPYLSGVLGTQFVRGLQGEDPRYLKVVSTPKHFAGNNEEHNRFKCNPQISEKQLREYYLPAFEACVKEGKAASMMAAYNAINDVPCTVNPWLLTKVLRNDWGFDGYVVSDCGGPSLVISGHNYVKTKEASATLSIKAGLDLECGDDVYKQPLLNAYQQQMVSLEEIDRAAYRVVQGRMRLGLFDDPEHNPYNQLAPSVVGSEKHHELALEAARQSIVLLKNKNNLLPLNPAKLKSIAVVGINAGSCEFGDYSGAPANEPISVLEGIRRRVGKDIKVVYAPWKSAKDGLELIQGDHFPEGLKVEYFDNTDLKGTPVVRQESWVNFEPANQAPDPFLPKSPLSIRWTGKLRPTVSGRYALTFMSDDGCRLKLDGKTLIDSWQGHSVQTDTVMVDLTANQTYDLSAEYYDNRDYAVARLQWRVPEVAKKERIDLYGEAGKAVRECDMAIAVLGINKSIEREGQDRYDIQLPADQREFIQEIYKLNPNTIVVLVAGSSLAIHWIDEHIPAIVNAWYPGEQGGTAIAEVLFGDYNPAGRLPLTYYSSLDELPAFDDYDITKGRTYQYFKGKPLYPFGYGLSYTSFKYSQLKVDDKGDSLAVSFRVNNEGKRDGDEISQLYVKLPTEGSAIKELKGFKRTFIRKGETVEVSIHVKKESLRYWDDQQERFIVSEGIYPFLIGTSSDDIRLKQDVNIHP